MARRCASVAGHATVLFQRLGDLAADRQHRIERGHRLLEHHADLTTADLAHFCSRKLHDIATGKQNLTACDASGRISDETQQRERTDRLARSAFADDGYGFPRLHRVGDAVDGTHDSRTGTEFGVQIPDFQEW